MTTISECHDLNIVRNKSLINIQREVKALQSTNFIMLQNMSSKNVNPSWFIPTTIWNEPRRTNIFSWRTLQHSWTKPRECNSVRIVVSDNIHDWSLDSVNNLSRWIRVIEDGMPKVDRARMWGCLCWPWKSIPYSSYRDYTWKKMSMLFSNCEMLECKGSHVAR